jgi:hypothetical protein
VSDTDPPRRVVDVAALAAGEPDMRVWLSSGRIRVGRDDRRRRVRVDVQRIGGWAGQAHLAVQGLPGAVGSATFDRPGANLAGPTALGARLTLRLKRTAPQGPRQLSVRAEAPDGSPAAARAMTLVVDRGGPRVSGLRPHIRGDVPLADPDGSTRVVMRWSVMDTYSKVAQAILQRKIGKGAWRPVPGTRTSARVTLKPGRSERFRVRSRDSLGNARTSPSLMTSLVVRDADASAWQLPAGGWHRRAARGALGDTLLVASGSTASLRTSLSGRSVAIVAPVGPERGRVRVRIDGGAWQEVTMRRPRSALRRVVFATAFGRGTHRLEIQGLAGKTAIDAVLFVR